MTSLVDLRVTIYNDYQLSEAKLLAPLFAARAENFIVDLMWPSKFDTTNAPFKIQALTAGEDATDNLAMMWYIPRRHSFWRYACFPLACCFRA